MEVLRIIYHCGMHSDVSIVTGGQVAYLLEITHPRCQRVFNDGILIIGGASDIVDGLKLNRATSRSVTLAGTTHHNGSCKGTQYSDLWNLGCRRLGCRPCHFEDFLRSRKSGYREDHAEIWNHLLSAMDSVLTLMMDTFWKSMPISSCNFHQYDVLYKGPATKITDTMAPSPTVYSLVTEDICPHTDQRTTSVWIHAATNGTPQTLYSGNQEGRRLCSSKFYSDK